MRFLVMILLFFATQFAYAQEQYLMFSYDFKGALIYCNGQEVTADFSYSSQLRLADDAFANLRFVNPVYLECTEEEIAFLDGLEGVKQREPFRFFQGVESKKRLFIYEVWPFRFSKEGGWEKLIHLGLESELLIERRDVVESAANSVLSTSSWYKVSVLESGVHELTYANFQEMGLNPSEITPANIRVYGRPAGMLSFLNSEERVDDLQELAIQLEGMGDGTFDAGDRVLFYGESPHSWSWDEENARYQHQTHLYADETNYFVNVSLGEGKRIQQLDPPLASPTHQVSTFDDYAYYEEEVENFIMSGRNWYGQKMSSNSSQSYSFSFPNVVGEANLRVLVAGRSVAPYTSSFSVSGGGLSLNTINLQAVSGEHTSEYAKLGMLETTFTPNTTAPQFNLAFQSASSSASGWLDYISVHVRRQLKLSGDQLLFRDQSVVGEGNVAAYNLQNTIASTQLWEVTNPLEVGKYALEGNTFVAVADTLRTFLAFNGAAYSVLLKGQVGNQNLHALDEVDMVIVCHPLFWTEAERLKLFHETQEEGFSVALVSPQQVYNEFSAGAQDVTAIRDFMRMLYEKQLNPPRYLLLFGDGSYDPKNRIPGNTNFVISYQSENSTHPTKSYVSDDFFALLDEEESISSSGEGLPFLDIGVGRFPVQTVAEAKIMVDKVLAYSEEAAMGSWRNQLCFVGDDIDWEFDSNHSAQAEDLSGLVSDLAPSMNINKIYIDAYPQESTPGGQRAPHVNTAINEQMNKGALLINYTGHGGEVGWAHERILGLDDISSWDNASKMPLFVTATCEFSRFDDPERTSAGEYVVLAENGGAIAMFTTTRVVYSSPNFDLNEAFLEQMFASGQNEAFPAMGDLIKKAKNNTVNAQNTNHRNFTLLGDPALCLAYPKYQIVLDEAVDTLKALGLFSISGQVNGLDGTLLENFEGVVYPTIFDKSKQYQTLGQDASPVMYYDLQNNVLFNGAASVEGGTFTFEFVVPKDINYDYGNAKVSLYAKGTVGTQEVEDAAGADLNIVVGGTSQDYTEDLEGPSIQLFMNDVAFVAGGITDENPDFLALLHDEKGINTVGNGIGHDVVAILDEETANPIVLNEFYESDINSYQSGSLRYPLSNLAEGPHTIRLKAWDVYNNSSEESLDFIVMKSQNFAIENLLNYPNPMQSYTDFYFDHNASGQTLELSLQIYSLQGSLVASKEEVIYAEGYRLGPIRWHLGSAPSIAQGMYVYRLQLENEEGQRIDKSGRLVIID